MGKASRDKGKIGEREVARILRDAGFDARRGQQYRGGAGSPDVVGVPGFHVEVKRTEQLRLYDAMQQARDESGEGEVPVVIHRRNRHGWVAIMDLSDWPDLVGGRGFHVEVKRTESFRLYDAMQQSRDDSGKDEIPVVFHRRNKQGWVVVMDLSDWLELVGGRDEPEAR